MAINNPVHPGKFIRTEVIEAHGLSVTAGAKVLGVSRPALSNLLNQNADLSGKMALRMRVSQNFWMCSAMAAGALPARWLRQNVPIWLAM